MLRRVELGAGVAAAALTVIAFAVLLFAPLVAYCAVATQGGACPAGAVRYASLVHFGGRLGFGVWGYLLGMALILLLGAGGAIAEARFRVAGGALLLWPGAVMAFFGCALTLGDTGLFLFPAVLALLIAASASITPRVQRRRALAASAAPPPAEPPETNSPVALDDAPRT